jgi:hypothetical protein
VIGALAVGGCGTPAEAATRRAPESAVKPEPSSPPGAAANPSEIAIPRGLVELGSRPGTARRDGGLEADLVSVERPAVHIDALPFPNEPGAPARTAVGRAEAIASCQSTGKRLCTELEWERACKGPHGASFLTGETLELQRCKTHPSSCRSPEGVLGLGIALEEWTSSDAQAGLGSPLRTAVVRGATLDAEASAHRCAARSGASPDSRSPTRGFRCCRGAAPATTYPVEPERPFARPLGLDTERARAALRQIPQLESLAASFTPFSDADADAALRRGGASRSAITVWQFQTSTFAWSPASGEELHVLSGRSDRGALLAVLHAGSDGRLTHAASTIVDEPDATIAVGGSAEHPLQLIFTTCHGCPGEGGTAGTPTESYNALHLLPAKGISLRGVLIMSIPCFCWKAASNF